MYSPHGKIELMIPDVKGWLTRRMSAARLTEPLSPTATNVRISVNSIPHT